MSAFVSYGTTCVGLVKITTDLAWIVAWLPQQHTSHHLVYDHLSVASVLVRQDTYQLYVIDAVEKPLSLPLISCKTQYVDRLKTGSKEENTCVGVRSWYGKNSNNIRA